jgi:cardiolipin synthase A/B
MDVSLWVWVPPGMVVLLVLFIWSMKRHRAPTLQVHCDFPIDELTPSLSGLTLGTAVGGNSVEVFENGAFFETLIEGIRGGQRTIHFETFLWKDGTLGRRVADALSAQARSGKKVRVMLDATGSRGAGKDVIQQMRDAGCSVKFFH